MGASPLLLAASPSAHPLGFVEVTTELGSHHREGQPSHEGAEIALGSGNTYWPDSRTGWEKWRQEGPSRSLSDMRRSYPLTAPADSTEAAVEGQRGWSDRERKGKEQELSTEKKGLLSSP